MWLICAGGKRSGSTLQYNIVSRIVELSGSGERVRHFRPEEFSGIKEEYRINTGFKVIKTHGVSNFVKELVDSDQALVFHSFRDLRDVVVSYLNKGWIERNENDIKVCTVNYLREYREWKSLNAPICNSKYEDFVFNIAKEIRKYLDFLELDLQSDIIDQIADELNLERLKSSQSELPESKMAENYNNIFHKDTLLHTDHIHSGDTNQFIDVLDENEISLIEGVAHDYLRSNGYLLTWPNSKRFMSYSQHADDYIAWQILGKKPKGLAIEVGAFDGVHLSNTMSFDELGWKTICIEPNPNYYPLLEKNRPNAVVEPKAIVGNPSIKEVDFYAEKIGVLSGCQYDDEDVKRRYENRGLNYVSPEIFKVDGITLNELLISLEIKQVDLLSIDVEGFEMEVLKGMNLKKFKVSLLIIEGNTESSRRAILNYFLSYKEYHHIGDNKQNMFFIHQSAFKRSRLRKLNLTGYIKAKQEHPYGKDFTIDSTCPDFQFADKIKKVGNPLRFLKWI